MFCELRKLLTISFIHFLLLFLLYQLQSLFLLLLHNVFSKKKKKKVAIYTLMETFLNDYSAHMLQRIESRVTALIQIQS